MCSTDKCYPLLLHCDVTGDEEILKTSLWVQKSVPYWIHIYFIPIHNIKSTDWEGLCLHDKLLKEPLLLSMVGATCIVMQLKSTQPRKIGQSSCILKIWNIGIFSKCILSLSIFWTWPTITKYGHTGSKFFLHTKKMNLFLNIHVYTEIPFIINLMM